METLRMQAWKRLGSRHIVTDRWISLRADRCELPSGHTIEPYYVLEERDWVHVVAIDDAQGVLVVEQYRHGAATVCVEFPGGITDPGESPLQAGQRELLEETGYSARAWTKVGEAYANPARQTNRVHTFVARGLSEQAPQRLDEAEQIAVAFAKPDELERLVSEGRFSQSMHIASLYFARDALRK
jgi:8-oxo-dGTP pyrophosphatase MutT (NUDIX family)